MWVLATWLGMSLGVGWAHALQVFASVDGTVVQGSAYFTGGGPARAVPVGIEFEAADAPAPTQLADTVTDEQGSFRIVLERVPPLGDATVQVVAETIDGHRAVWTLTEQDLAGVPRQAPPRSVAVPQILTGLAGIVVMTSLAGWVARRRG